MRPYLIGPEQQEQLQQLKDFAESNPFTMADMLAIANKQAPPPGDRKGFSIHIPYGVRIVFSVHAVDPDGVDGRRWCKHVSMSVDSIEKLPSVEGVNFILPYLGFTKQIPDPDLHLHLEPTEKPHAINVIEFYDK